MSYTHLTEKDRRVISHLRLAKFSLREIARRLGRHHTSISREIKRNGPTHPANTVYGTTSRNLLLRSVGIRPEVIIVKTIRHLLNTSVISSGLIGPQRR